MFLPFRLCLLSFFTTFALAAIIILEPKPGAHVKMGHNFTVKVEEPVRHPGINAIFYLHSLQVSIEGPIQVALVIGLQSCPSTSCVPGDMGLILYNGPFNPEFHNGQQPSQSFVVTAPSGLEKGKAVLEVLHLGLLGVS